MWSDGVPLTANDVLFSYDAIMELGPPDENGDETFVLAYSGRDSSGYSLISDFRVIDDVNFEIDMESFFAGWKGLFAQASIWPAHAFPGGAAQLQAGLGDWVTPAGDPIPSSGPMIWNGWERGVSMHLMRNDNYHGSVSPDAVNTGVTHIDDLRINFVPDTDAQINALKTGEAHIIFTQPEAKFGEQISTDSDFTVASTAGPVFEHWGLNLLNAHLADPLVREALAYALDKGEVVERLYQPLFGQLPARGLGNTFWMSNQPQYVDHQTQYDGAQIEAARANLEAAGYTRGTDGIYEHEQRGRLSLRVGTTGGNSLRELQEQLVQGQMAGAGIEIIIDNVDGRAYFDAKPFADEAIAAANSNGAEGDPTIWDITQFAWVGGPWPGGQTGAYASDGFGPYGFNNSDFDVRGVECGTIVDDDERASCYNELDEYVTTLNLDPEKGLFMLPFTQTPTYYAYANSALVAAAVAPDDSTAGPLANIVDFQFG